MSKVKFDAVKELIQEGKYNEARSILATLNHPTAREWERKLDQRQGNSKQKNPSSDTGDRVLYKASPSMFRNQPIMFIFLVVVFPIGVFIIPFWWLTTKNTTLTITNHQISMRKGILSKSTNDIYLSDVRNVKVHQGLLQRMLGTGYIEISTSSGNNDDIRIGGLPNPYQIKAIIDQHRRG